MYSEKKRKRQRFHTKKTEVSYEKKSDMTINKVSHLSLVWFFVSDLDDFDFLKCTLSLLDCSRHN